MSNRRITLFELHTHGSNQFGPRTLGRGEAEEELEEAEDEDEEGGRSVLPVLLGVLVLAGAAFAIRKYRGGDEEEETDVRESVPLAESDDVTATAD